MKALQRVNYDLSTSDVQNINHIEQCAKDVGKPIDRETARTIYRSIKNSELYTNDKYQVALRRHRMDAPEAENPLIVSHLSIKRIDKKAQRDWRDFQEIKNQLLGKEVEAVELYPAESRKVDAANQYHLWALPEGQQWPIGFTEGLINEDSNNGAIQRPFNEEISDETGSES